LGGYEEEKVFCFLSSEKKTFCLFALVTTPSDYTNKLEWRRVGMGELDGRVAIVTGAGQGIGQGVAVALAKAGAKLVIASKTAEKLSATRDLIESAGGEVLLLGADVCSPADIAQIVAVACEGFGGVDILVNNAQQAVLGPLLELDDAGYQKTFDSGPLAVFRLMKACVPHMKMRGGGSIINFASSVAVNWNTSGTGVYGSMKQAIRSLSRAAASEWGPDNIRVNTIAPLASSPSLAAWLQALPGGMDPYLATIPLRRVGDPELDIGRVVVFLAGAASAYITGATLPVDGGQANFG
jgi:NAD(P)-dependent dehydrogenase (short-subunit alcohol dehydrogenase family)